MLQLATQSLGLHQTVQSIVDHSGHVTWDEEVASISDPRHVRAGKGGPFLVKAFFNQPRRGTSNENQDSVVFTHSKHSGHQFNSEDIIILDKEENWFERLVKEVIWECVEQPSLNKKRVLSFLLSHTWDPILK